MLNSLLAFFEQIDPVLAYSVLFVSAFIENTFPPIPGDTCTVLGAYLISSGKLDFWGVYLSTTFGSVFGFFTMFLLGKNFGRSLLDSKLAAKTFKPDQVKRVQVWFSSYGYWVIAGNRFLSGTRSVISLFAGFFHLKWIPVILLATLSALIWNGLLIYGGYLLGINWQMITGILGQYNKIVIGLTVLIILYIIYRKKLKKKKKELS
ncbi:MAG: DedA family protein [Calditrichaceae bacterium]